MTKKQKLEKRKRKRRFFSILMILFTGLILSASTYAWFTANKDVDIESVDVNVSASTGLQISAYPKDEADWKTYVSASEFKAVTTNQFPDTISPVSTIGNVASATNAEGVGIGRMYMFSGSLDSTLDSTTHKDIYYLTSSVSNETTGTTAASTGGDYIAFDLYIRAGLDGEIYLTSGSKITINNSGRSDAATAGNGIENAARVAFVMEGYNASSALTASALSTYNCASNNSIAKDGSAISASATEASRCFVYNIWEPNASTHNANGISNAENEAMYGFSDTDVQNSINNGTALSYMGVKKAMSKFPIKSSSGVPVTTDWTVSDYFQTVTTDPTFTTGIDDSARIPAFRVKTGVNKVRVYVWIEGQDVDCEDKASNSTINVDLAFSLTKNVNA